jgi:hypothetical protein
LQQSRKIFEEVGQHSPASLSATHFGKLPHSDDDDDDDDDDDEVEVEEDTLLSGNGVCECVGDV